MTGIYENLQISQNFRIPRARQQLFEVLAVCLCADLRLWSMRARQIGSGRNYHLPAPVVRAETDGTVYCFRQVPGTRLAISDRYPVPV